ncbi:MAG: MFS transporter [Patescibacteria group bacterium]
MPTLHHLVRHIQTYGNEHRGLYLFATCIFFLILFDGIVSYMLPVIITERGFSTTTMGFIISASSIVGALFDFILSRFIHRVDFRRLFFAMFAVVALYPLFILHAYTIGAFLLAMAFWGIYFDLYVFSTFDYVSRYTKKEEHASSFGVVQGFASLGGLVAPLVAGAAIFKGSSTDLFVAAWVALGISFLCFLALAFYSQETKVPVIQEAKKKKGMLSELLLWVRIGKILRRPVLLTFCLHLFNAVFWTLGPLYPHVQTGGLFNALLLVSYGLPVVLTGWLAGPLTKRFGKKRVAFSSLIAGSLTISSISLFSNPGLIILVSFVASTFIALAWPSISGAYADYISETPSREEEIEGVQDFFGNGGYVVGPIAAGFFADVVGIPMTFTIFGIFCACIGAYLSLGAKQPITV